ncbi:MAG: hypothetical protein GX124_02075 [Clostridiales bacterium]|nr:hypothetical protein [Clostridiales bacterium]
MGDKQVNRRKIILFCFMMALLLVTLSGCVPGDGANSQDKPAGFFWGVWHGWIAPITLIFSVFKHDVGIYEVYNSGFWYNLGYYMAIISGFGGLALARGKRRKDCADKSR